MNQKKYFKRTKLKAKGFVKGLVKKMLETEKNMESIAKRFEKQENNFKNLIDKVKSLEVMQREYKESTSKRLSHLEDQINMDKNDDIELQQVKNL